MSESEDQAVVVEAQADVLVVDADALSASLIEACLDFEGASVESVASLALAQPALRPDLKAVVVDLDLPDGDGRSLLEPIARLCPNARVVLCVERDRRAEVEAEVELGLGVGAGVVVVDRGDLARITEVLGLEPERSHLPDDRLLHITALDRD